MKRVLWFLTFALIASSVLAAGVTFSVVRTTLTPNTGGRFNTVPSFALNTKTGNTLVIWERRVGEQHAILGKLLNSSGKIASSVFTLVSSNTISHPSVAYNPTTNEFLLAFDNNPNFELSQTDIFVMRLNANGRSLGMASKITTDIVSSTMTNFLPTVVYNSKVSKFAVVWNREVTTSVAPGNNGLVALLLDATGAPSGNVALMRLTTVEQMSGSISLLIPIPLDVKVHPTSGKLAVGFLQKLSGTGGAGANYYYGAVAGDLSNAPNFAFSTANTAQVSVTNGFVWGLRLIFAPSGRGLLVFVDNTRLEMRKLNGSAVLATLPKAAFGNPKSNTKFFYPNLAVSSGLNGYRILATAIQNPFSPSGNATVWAQLMDGTGLRLGAPVKLDQTDSKNTAQESGFTVLPHPANSETYPFLFVYKLAGFTPPGQTFNGSALILLNVKIN